ncbi:MAG: hypothetical protein WD645_03540, partial [Dehalococcoidia bacterium]
VEGDLPTGWAFNPKYLTALLETHKGERVEFRVRDELKPVVSVDPDSDDSFGHLLMPVKP